MLTRRLVEHLRTQNWTAVCLDLFIVIAGIFIAMKVSDYANQLDERKQLVQKLAILVEESHAIKIAINQPTDLLNSIIANAAKLNEMMHSCSGGENVNEYLDVLGDWDSISDTEILDTKGLSEHYGLLSLQFIKSLRHYESESQSLISHSKTNDGLLTDLHLLKSPLIGVQSNNTKIKLISPFESLCNTPEFEKLVNFPSGMAQIQLRLQNQMTVEVDDFLIALESELKSL